ncbi:ABC transporter substrate-binding protein [Peribacillus saganii]|uniref:ABC transporter substrate-binding protein n=1 Tax=Peribacillus saganii TaxID=2303992 RepID=A0A372LP50_9BACI|nr:ABC transporter substrate-binding protein [Peribacillus saganii]RFU68925.1 ABC transporter substrate-binding protein [Peribacillus saganii]
MKRNVKLSFILLLAFSLLLSACSGGGKKEANATTKDGKVIIDFWSFWGSETRRPVIEKIVDDFNKSQDEIEVKHTFVPWGDIWTKNLAAVAAGNPADVIVNDLASVAHRADNQQAEDLSKLISKDLQSNLYPHLWEPVLYKDKPYAVPFTSDTRVLFYNKEAFKEAGLDPEKPPTTWAELEEYAKKLDVKKGKKYDRIGFYPLWGSFGAGSWMSNADGGKGFIEDGKLAVNTPKKAEALEWVQGWNKRIGDKNVQAFEAEFSSGQTNPFVTEKVAMWIDIAGFYTQIRDSGKEMEIGVAPIPEQETGSGHWNEGGGFALEIPKGSKHPKEAAKFIEYMASEQAQKYWALKNYDNVANVKAAESAATEMKDIEKTVYDQALANLKDTKLHTVPLEYPDYKTRLDPQLEAAIIGKMSAKEALEKAEKDIEELKK